MAGGGTEIGLHADDVPRRDVGRVLNPGAGPFEVQVVTGEKGDAPTGLASLPPFGLQPHSACRRSVGAEGSRRDRHTDFGRDFFLNVAERDPAIAVLGVLFKKSGPSFALSCRSCLRRSRN